MIVGFGTGAHAWSKAWTGNRWVHADATWNEFDNPSCYYWGGCYWNTVVYDSYGDDRRGSYSIWDGNAYNGMLDGQDWKYSMSYDGPNAYNWG